jgi:hypothetical protein
LKKRQSEWTNCRLNMDVYVDKDMGETAFVEIDIEMEIGMAVTSVRAE